MNPVEQRTEALLRSAAASAAWPPTPDLRDAVLGRIATVSAGADTEAPATRGEPARAARAVRSPRRRVVARALVVALLALVALAGVAAALGYRLPGLDIVFVERLPPAGSGLELGSPVPLGEALDGALDGVPPRVLLPAALPLPETALVLGAGEGRLVTLAWRAAAGERVIPGTDLALAITALAGDTDDALLRKLLGPGTTIQPADVGGERGWWISGAAHDLLVERPDGTVALVTSRLAGDTLVFVRDGTLYRLESALGLDRTLEVAASLR